MSGVEKGRLLDAKDLGDLSEGLAKARDTYYEGDHLKSLAFSNLIIATILLSKEINKAIDEGKIVLTGGNENGEKNIHP